jgi:hypothetical protein
LNESINCYALKTPEFDRQKGDMDFKKVLEDFIPIFFKNPHVNVIVSIPENHSDTDVFIKDDCIISGTSSSFIFYCEAYSVPLNVEQYTSIVTFSCPGDEEKVIKMQEDFKILNNEVMNDTGKRVFRAVPEKSEDGCSEGKEPCCDGS